MIYVGRFVAKKGLDTLLRRHNLLRLCDGGVSDNVPVRSAWQHIQRAGLPGTGSRNTVVLALDSFAPRLLTPLWYPLQSIAAPAVARNRPYAHVYKSFRRTLSPLALLPSQRSLQGVVDTAKDELLSEVVMAIDNEVHDAWKAAVATGENLRESGEYMALIDNEAIDVVQIGQNACGFTGAMQIADLAYGFELPVAMMNCPANFIWRARV